MWCPGDCVLGHRAKVGRTDQCTVTAAVQAATSPFQCALTTKSGGECVAHAIQSLTNLNSQVTVLTIDGISAYDSISRAAMFDCFNSMPNLRSVGWTIMDAIM